jgi:hypothetical protein
VIVGELWRLCGAFLMAKQRKTANYLPEGNHLGTERPLVLKLETLARCLGAFLAELMIF